VVKTLAFPKGCPTATNSNFRARPQARKEPCSLSGRIYTTVLPLILFTLDKIKKMPTNWIVTYARMLIHLISLSFSSSAGSLQNKQTPQRKPYSAKQILDYISSNPNAKNRFRALDMILNIHLDASCLSTGKGQSHAGVFSLEACLVTASQSGSMATCILHVPSSSLLQPLQLRRNLVHYLSTAKMGHPQPLTSIHVDNTTTLGIINNTITRQ